MNRLALWFFDHGIGTFPIITPGKEPACGSWDDFTTTRDRVARFRNYGVRLGGCRQGWLAVLDTDNAETEAWVVRHVPPTPFMVQTARGLHRYYRLLMPEPKFIIRDGLTIEFRNQGQYVVGPGSIHPGDVARGIPPGRVYTAADWSWRWDDIARFPADFDFGTRAPGQGGSSAGPFELPEEIRSGERHHQLFRLTRSLKGLGVDKNTTREQVTLANLKFCKPPLDEDQKFDAWFERAYEQPDRPLPTRPEIPEAGFEAAPTAPVDLDDIGELEGF